MADSKRFVNLEDDGSVPVTIVGGSSSGTQYAVDAALGATPTGTLAVAKRDDVLSALTPIEGDAVELRVDSVGALWATVSTLVPGTGATALGKAEDAAHASGDVGVMALAVRQDSAAALAGTTGDYAPIQVDKLGSLRVNGSAVQSALAVNSSTTPLSSAATFTGTAEQNDCPDVMVSCFTDNGGTLYCDFSVNGTDWRTFPSAGFTVAASVHELHTAVKGPRFFRVRLVNDAGAQSILQLYTYYGTFSKLNAPLNQALGADSDAQTVKAVMSATDPDGSYVNVGANQFGALQVGPEQRTTLDTMDATTGWAALGNDTLNLATTTKHVTGTLALTFDKVNGAANTIFAGIEKTLTALNFGDVAPHDILSTTVYLPTLTDVSYVWLRVGTSASHYNEWRIAVADLTAATFEILIFNVSDANYAGITGNGWNPAVVTYAAVGVAFNAETDALAGIVFDNISFHTNLHTSASISAEVSTSVSTANINLFRVGGTATTTGAGNVSAGTQRTTLAANDPAVVALQVMDDWDNGASDGASVSGDVAHDAVDAGEPVKIGGKAISAEPTAVAAADRVNALFDLVGKLIVLPYANPENFVSGAITSAMTGTTSTSLLAAPAAGLRNYITQIVVSNAHASVGTDVAIQDGSGGTTLYTIPAAAVYGGAVVTFPVPLRQPTTATAIFCANVTTGASTKVSAIGYKGA